MSHLMFCWPCIIVYQYSETKVMHFLFNLLRVKGLYMFRALLAQPQVPLHKKHLVYCVRVMSVGCYQGCSSNPSAVCAAYPEDQQVMLQICRCSWFWINWMQSASRWFHYTDVCITFRCRYRKGTNADRWDDGRTMWREPRITEEFKKGAGVTE
jgi:hypothetical protein